MLYFGLLFGRTLRRRLARDDDGKRKALKEAKAGLREAKGLREAGEVKAFYAALAKATKGLLESRLGQAVGAMTHDRLRAYLAERGMAESLAKQVVEEMEGYELARFSRSGGDAAETQEALKRAASLIDELARFRPEAGEDEEAEG